MLTLQEKIEIHRQIRELELAIVQHKRFFHDAQDNGKTAEWRREGRVMVQKLNTLLESAGKPKQRHDQFRSPSTEFGKLVEACGIRFDQLTEFARIVESIGQKTGLDRERTAYCILKDKGLCRDIRTKFATMPVVHVPQTLVKFTDEDADLLAELGAE